MQLRCSLGEKQEKTIKLRDIIKYSAIIRPRTKFVHYLNILFYIVYARPVQREDIISRPTQSLKRFLQVAAVIMCALYASSSRIAADSIFSAFIAVPLFADVHQTIYLMEHPH